MELYDLSHWHVLAVDDEPDSLEVLTEVLEMNGANVRAALGGQEALNAIQDYRPTLIITDLSMPGIDGYALLRKIRAAEAVAKTPVIALTAHAMLGDKEMIMSAGFDGYITKPLRIDTLIGKIFENIPSLKPA